MAPFCAACGNTMTADDRFCRVCGRMASAGAGATPTATATPVAAGPAETSGKAIASLICGLSFFVPFLFVAAIVFGHLALSEIRKSAGRLKGEGLAIAGLVLGYLWIVGIPIILIIAAIAIPNLLRARMAANEASAVASIRSLVTAEVSYSTAHPNRGYTCTLSDLAGDHLINSVLASGQRNGYEFELLNCAPETSGGPNAKFQVVAHPMTANQTGVRAFCSDESAVVKVDAGGSAQGCLENGSMLQ
jgi:type IV pilus assembly protein PilA